MRPGGGHGKGATFERLCCKRLSLFVTRGVRDDVFWRSSMSGGRATLQLKQDIVNLAQSGDMTAIAREGYDLCERCLFEYKAYKDLNILEALLKGTGLLAKFWRETGTAAHRYSKNPVLIAKQNYMPAIILCPIGGTVFQSGHAMTAHRLRADVYLMEEATKVLTRPRK
jgi:hypothetical protein